MYPKLVETDIAYLQEVVGEKHVFVGADISEDYAHDELGEVQAFPEVLVEPDSAEAVAQVMRYAMKRASPLPPGARVQGFAEAACRSTAGFSCPPPASTAF